MHYINITVREKNARADDRARIVCGNSDYTVRFDFDEEWAEYAVKTARFITEGGFFTDVQFSGSDCAVPVLSGTRTLLVGVFAGDVRTTAPAYIPAIPCITDNGRTPAAPPPDVYAQLMERFDKMEAPAAVLYSAQELTDEQKATARNNIGAGTGSDSGYSLTDADKAEISTLVLAQAKASGEFDGPSGPQGPAGVPGKDGKDGSDATVTAANIAGALGYTPVKPSDVPTVDINANTAARHTHANKAAIDGITGQVTADKVDAPDHATDLVQYGAFQIAANRIISQIPTVPTALKNPNALTINLGGITVDYDGSMPVNITIDDGTEVYY